MYIIILILFSSVNIQEKMHWNVKILHNLQETNHKIFLLRIWDRENISK